MSYDVGSNFMHHASDPNGSMAKRLYISSVDYSDFVTKWPTVKREWNSIRAANVSIGLDNTSQLFNFFHEDKTRLKDAVDIDYGVRYKSHNLMKWSHVFSATDWTKLNGSLLIDAISNPIDQEVDADKFFVDTTVNTYHFCKQIITKRLVFEGANYWCDAHVKPAECLGVYFQLDNEDVFPSVTFDVESGTVVTSGGSKITDSFIRQETNGWYHVGVKVTAAGSDYLGMAMFPTNPTSKSQIAWTGNGSDGMYFYGANIQEAQYAESHRYFMTDGDRQEPYGMNLLQYTENCSGWTQSAGLGITLNSTLSPDGAATADTVQDSSGAAVLSISQSYALTEAQIKQHDYFCYANYVKEGTAEQTKIKMEVYDSSSNTSFLRQYAEIDWSADTVSEAQQRTDVHSGTAFISAAGMDSIDDGWRRLWVTIKNPGILVNLPSLSIDRIKTILYPAGDSAVANSGTAGAWGGQLEVGGRELLSGPGAYVAVSTTGTIYPSTAEDTIDIFDGTIRDANFSRGRLQLQAKDKFRQLSDRIVGTGEDPIAVDSITPSWLAFTLCSCYGGMSDLQTTANLDIDWSAVDSWDSYNVSNAVHVKIDLRGMKVTEALKRIGRMTRTAIFMEEDRVTFRRWTNVATEISVLNNNNLIDIGLSVNDENLVNKQWVFGDWDESSNYYQLTVFDEDTASQNSFGLHERIIRDQAIFYVTSDGALDTAQRIIANEKEPVDVVKATSIVSALPMQLGESISIDDPLLNINGTFRIMGSRIDINKDRIGWSLDNSQLILANPFLLDTSSLGGADVLS